MAETQAQPTSLPIDSLEDLQSAEQRLVLKTVAKIRKCGLEAVLPLPQIVVCGNQSSGKSSVLEALTEVPFPRNDNLCTRFATEITLRNAPVESLRLSIIPGETRSAKKKVELTAFSEKIADFSELPRLMAQAAKAMEIGSGADDISASATTQAFARDVLSFVIEGPDRPQFTVVDVPGLIQNVTKGVTKQDKEMVAEITEYYIKQPRTICLAVIQATDDYANQPIVSKVREVDPEGNRTLGIITKPDRLDHGSGTEAAFISLARNEDVFFKLGWHVVKNRKFEEAAFSIEERNDSEARFFYTSNFKELPSECCGIQALRSRLSGLLFDHIKRELPKLRQELDALLSETSTKLQELGSKRSTARECRDYLTHISMKFVEIIKAAVDGHYEGEFFQYSTDSEFDVDSPQSAKRFRAVIQFLNREFAKTMQQKGPKYFILPKDISDTRLKSSEDRQGPIVLSHDEALKWTTRVLIRSRGKEPIGNYNPLILGELFRELSSRWNDLAEDHVEKVAETCAMFTNTLLDEICPEDVHAGLSVKITETLDSRRIGATEELEKLMKDKLDFPTAYNHDYTDSIKKARLTREQLHNGQTSAWPTPPTPPFLNYIGADSAFGRQADRDMEEHTCEEVIDDLISMYKTQQKTFVANVTSQVIERHMVRGLEKIFSPLDVNELSDEEVFKVASESAAIRRNREFLLDRQNKLLEGRSIFRGIIGRIK